MIVSPTARWGTPPEEYLGGNMLQMPGHVKVGGDPFCLSLRFRYRSANG